MQPESIASPSPVFDLKQVPGLACPVCHGDLRQEAAHVVCTGCSCAYPVVDGIPVLIPARAEQC